MQRSPQLLRNLVLLIAGGACLSQSTARADLSCADLSNFATHLVQQHLRQRSLDMDLRRLAARTFVLELAAARTDVRREAFDRAIAEVELVFTEMRRGDCSRLDRVADSLAQGSTTAQSIPHEAHRGEWLNARALAALARSLDPYSAYRWPGALRGARAAAEVQDGAAPNPSALHFERVTSGGRSLEVAVIELTTLCGTASEADSPGGSGNGVAGVVRALAEQLAEVERRGVAGLLLDLSRNRGGLIDAAIAVSGVFLGADVPIVGIRDRHGELSTLAAEGASSRYDGPLVVLTSRATASAAEIVAGALRDHRRAVLVGADHTYGKGTEQTVTPLGPGFGALDITTGLLFRPNGESIQFAGIPAHIVVAGAFASGAGAEQPLPNALEFERRPPLVSEAPGPERARRGWSTVDDGTVAELVERSRSRDAASPDRSPRDEALRVLGDLVSLGTVSGPAATDRALRTGVTIRPGAEPSL